MEERLSGAGGEILAAVRLGVATVTLNRPQALNALTLGMLEALTQWFDAWERDDRVRTIFLRGAGEKAFCAGGDIRALHDAFKAGDDVYRFFEVEYTLDERIYGFAKPVVAFIDGIVMGGGMGLAQGARLRLVGERTKMAMPETAIGLFPDVGGSYFLSRLEGHLGVYLGLVGPTLRAADAIYCGLADQYIGTAPLGEPGLAKVRPAIERHFGHASVAAIVASLEGERDPAYADFATKSLERLAKASPTMLEVTLEQVRRGAKLDLPGCFRMERSMIRGAFGQGDFIEGIRALVIDKDNAPRWQPPTLAEVRPDAVARFFPSTGAA
jgi:enoyl-CoA hydratase/carnithine racemase